jgi:hypothetical protein
MKTLFTLRRKSNALLDLIQECLDYKLHLAELNLENDSLKEELQAHRNRERERTDKQAESQQVGDKLQSELSALKEELFAAKTKLKKYQHELESLSSSALLNTELRNHVNALEKERENHSAKKEKIKVKHGALEKRNQELEDMYVSSSRELDRVNRQLSEKTSRITRLKTSAKETESELREQVEGLKRALKGELDREENCSIPLKMMYQGGVFNHKTFGKIRVPEGTAEGQRLRVKGRGRSTSTGTHGDAYLMIVALVESPWGRAGNDITGKVELTKAEQKESCFNVTMPHGFNRSIRLDELSGPNFNKDRQELRVSGLGVPVINGLGKFYGDLILTVELEKRFGLF